MLDELYIEKLTGLSSRLRGNMICKYNKMNETTRIEVHQRQTEIYTKWRNNARESEYRSDRKAETSYSAFIHAIWELVKEEKKIAGSKEEADQQLERDIERMLDNRGKKPAGLKDLIAKKYFTEITRMRDKDISWRDISHWLHQRHKVSVSHTYLKQVTAEIAQTKLLHKMADAVGVEKPQ